MAAASPITGEITTIDGIGYYRIANYERMRPFFMTVVSGSDHWMFISSTGAPTAGRGDPDRALFPYYTDDKIHDSAEVTGPKTIFRVETTGTSHVWEPFSDRGAGFSIRRTLYKSLLGNALIFEEDNDDLGLTFRYSWFNSQRFGWVRRARLNNGGSSAIQVKMLDGLQNILPAGVGSQLQLEKSTLVDAYKKSELLPGSGLGLFLLSSRIIDRPEPAESLRATAVWSLGLRGGVRLLSSRQLVDFRRDGHVHTEGDIRGERGAYFIQKEVTLRPGKAIEWCFAADVNLGPSQVAELDQLLRKPARLQRLVDADIELGTRELRQLLASADTGQKTAAPLADARHSANVLFNVMRGGVFRDGYQIDIADLRQFVQRANQDLATRHAAFFRRLKSGAPHSRVMALAASSGDANLERLCRDYLPLTFSRRHGDPSRPWNRFSIPGHGADGKRALNYEGNWRDIFQNWEALAVSFPGYAAGMVCKFVNASTADGYNPYRVTRDGFDWEVPDPADPWSHIGYWGDHQIIYLLKLLEALDGREPEVLRGFLTRDIFAYANVPYRIKSYEQLLRNPRETVDFDRALDAQIRQRVAIIGFDGKLLADADGKVYLVNLTEKLLVPLLAKLTNFIPGAGIWLNTQRPEWNDANNALVGLGVSMVTLYYLRRYLVFCRDTFAALIAEEVKISAEVVTLLSNVRRVLEDNRALLSQAIGDHDRKRILDGLGNAGCRYRASIYATGFSSRRLGIEVSNLAKFFDLALEWIEQSMRANRREDGLYHAYNLIPLDRGETLPIRRLYEMLEGQVAVLSSGALSVEASLGVLRALRQSAMFRADQHSYLLYPNRALPRFTEKNKIPPGEIDRSRLLKKLLASGDTSLVEQDVAGTFHFNGSLANAADVAKALEKLAGLSHPALVKKEAPLVLEIFERMFDHTSFTGRSGTFFGYEGLGSIYWHMVSKLLLAVQETFFRAADSGASPTILADLAAAYYDIRAGLGDQKTPEAYGAFPMDPYSHTPAHAGARQPGLTGQVKEDVLCRFGELGVFARGGRIAFRPLLLRRGEFLRTPSKFRYFDIHGAEKSISLKPGSLAFTYCQIPIIYQLAPKNSVAASFADSVVKRSGNLRLDRSTSRLVFDRSGKVGRIVVSIATPA